MANNANNPMSSPSANSQHQRASVIWLVISQLLAFLSFVPWGFAAIMSPMLSDNADIVSPLMCLIWLYPLFVIGCVVMAWRSHRRKQTRKTLVLTSLPVAVMILVAIILAVTSL